MRVMMVLNIECEESSTCWAEQWACTVGQEGNCLAAAAAPLSPPTDLLGADGQERKSKATVSSSVACLTSAVNEYISWCFSSFIMFSVFLLGELFLNLTVHVWVIHLEPVMFPHTFLYLPFSKYLHQKVLFFFFLMYTVTNSSSPVFWSIQIF